MESCINDLTVAQQIFSVFYAIFFGIMLQTVGTRTQISIKNKKIAKLMEGKTHQATLNLFDTPNAWAIGADWNNKPLWRALISIFVLNVLPGAFFALVFSGLSELRQPLSLEQILILVIISLTPQYLYRIFYAFLTIKPIYEFLYLRKGTGGKYDKFSNHDEMAFQLLEEQRLKYPGHGNPYYHLAFPIFVFLPLIILLYNYLTSSQLPQFIMCMSWGVIIAGVISFFWRSGENVPQK
jgi:hypothetical protein